jgi:ABC-2 type transport system permease protein
MSRPATAIARLAVRRTWRGAAAVGAATVLVTVTAVMGFEASYPDPVDRSTLATSIGANPGLIALFGETRALDTLAGFAEWQVVLIMAVIGAVWMLLAATRSLRGEEEEGRAELLLAGPISPARATAATLAGLASSLLILLGASMMGLVVGAGPDLGAGRCALLALTLAGPPAAMLGVGAVTSQLSETRRRSAALAAAVLGASYLLRVVADSAADLRWLRWATPLGWLEVAHPLTEPRLLPILLPYLLGLALAGLALLVVGARDVGSGILSSRSGRRARTAGLTGPAGLALRLAQGPALAWAAGMAVFGALIGLVARTASDAMADATGGDGILAGIGIADTGTRAYVGVSFLFVTLALTTAAAGQVAATREEEASARVDALLVRPVGPVRWLAGRVSASVGLLVLAATAATVATVAAGRAGDLGIPAGDLLVAGLNTLPAAVLVLGAGTLLHGVLPRLAVPLTYALVAAAFLLEVVGSNVGLPGWLLDLSVLHHVAPAPAVSPDSRSAAVLVGLGMAAGGAGALALTRRDVVHA